MNAFAASIDLLFEDPNMAVDALYRAGGEGSGTLVRVIGRHLTSWPTSATAGL